MKTTKQCTKCKTIKDLSEFYKLRLGKQGVSSWCKACTLKQKKEYHIKNNKDILKKKKDYHSENRDKLIIKSKKYAEKNKHKRKEYDDKNRERNTKNKLEWREQNIVKSKEANKKYLSSTKGKLAKANSQHKRRSIIKRQADGSLPQNIGYPLTAELHNLLDRQDNRCNDCNTPISHTLNNIHLDHHVPLSKGGTHSIENIVWLCDKCNMTKSDTMPDTLLLIG